MQNGVVQEGKTKKNTKRRRFDGKVKEQKVPCVFFFLALCLEAPPLQKASLSRLGGRFSSSTFKFEPARLFPVASHRSAPLARLGDAFENTDNFIKALAGISQECEETLRAEAARFRTLYMQFCEDHANHQHAMKGIMSQFHQQQQELFTQYEQLRMRMKSEHDLLCSDKITELKLSMEIEESES